MALNRIRERDIKVQNNFNARPCLGQGSVWQRKEADRNRDPQKETARRGG